MRSRRQRLEDRPECEWTTGPLEQEASQAKALTEKLLSKQGVAQGSGSPPPLSKELTQSLPTVPKTLHCSTPSLK